MDKCIIFDNSDGESEIVARKELGEDIDIINKQIFEEIKSRYNEKR